MRLVILFCTVLTYCLSSSICAQEDKWEGGLFLGGSNYAGDIINSRFVEASETNFAYGLTIKRYLSPTFGLRLNMFRGEIGARDISNEEIARQERGWSFENLLTELSVLGQWEPLAGRRYDERGNFRRILSPYLFIGAGLGFSNPTPDFGSKTDARIQADLAQAPQQAVLTIPFGGGLRYDFNNRWNLGLEFGWRPAFNDYLDGISQAGNPENNDWYLFGGFTLTTRLGQVDSDGDGITDERDECPHVPGGAMLKGCPDADGDGIADPHDNCPGRAGTTALQGCPDRDLDGVTDADDACPDLPGLPGANGCPDTDRDGFIDSRDRCPEVAGIEAFGGCPDTDGDGIGDADDVCPAYAGPAHNNGCPVIAAADLATLKKAMSNVGFETNNDILLVNSQHILDDIAEIMQRYPAYHLKISGYTDNVGSEATNQSLSERRARACLEYLVARGIDRQRLQAAGYGESKPIASNETPEGRARNRRTEFELVLPQN